MVLNHDGWDQQNANNRFPSEFDKKYTLDAFFQEYLYPRQNEDQLTWIRTLDTNLCYFTFVIFNKFINKNIKRLQFYTEGNKLLKENYLLLICSSIWIFRLSYQKMKLIMKRTIFSKIIFFYFDLLWTSKSFTYQQNLWILFFVSMEHKKLHGRLFHQIQMWFKHFIDKIIPNKKIKWNHLNRSFLFEEVEN